jgi:hypothetical protein
MIGDLPYPGLIGRMLTSLKKRAYRRIGHPPSPCARTERGGGRCRNSVHCPCLADAGCEKIQRYLISPPLPPNNVRTLKDAGVQLGRLLVRDLHLFIIDHLQ